MKRTLLTRTACLLLMAGLLAACDDSDKPAPAPEPTPAEKLSGVYSNKSFTYSDKVLELSYRPSGTPSSMVSALAGREVEFQTEDFETGTLTLRKVLPGEDELTYSDLKMTLRSSGYYTVAGNKRDTTPGGITFSFSSSLYPDENRLTVSVLNVKLPDNLLIKNSENTGWWALAPFEYDYGSSGMELTSCSLHLKWKIEPGHTYTDPKTGDVKELKQEELDQTVSALQMLGGQILTMMLPKVLFHPGGIIRAYYTPSNPLSNDPLVYVLSPDANLCHFYVRDSKAYLVPNLDQIFQQIKADQTKAASVNLEDILAAINLADRWLSKDGIPFTIRENGDAKGSVTLYLGTDQMLTLLKLLPLLKDAVAGSELGGLLGGMIDGFNIYVPATKEFELGLTLVPSTDEAPVPPSAD